MVELGRLDQVDTLFTDLPPPEPFRPACWRRRALALVTCSAKVGGVRVQAAFRTAGSDAADSSCACRARAPESGDRAPLMSPGLGHRWRFGITARSGPPPYTSLHTVTHHPRRSGRSGGRAVDRARHRGCPSGRWWGDRVERSKGGGRSASAPEANETVRPGGHERNRHPPASARAPHCLPRRISNGPKIGPRSPSHEEPTCSPSTRAPPARAASCSTCRAASSRWRSASSDRCTRSRAGSSTNPNELWTTQLATAQEAMAKAGLTARATWPPSASPTSARPRWCGTAPPGRPSTTPSSGRDRPRRTDLCRAARGRARSHLPRQDRAGGRCLLFGHQAEVDSRHRARRTSRRGAWRTGLRHGGQLADVEAQRWRHPRHRRGAMPRAR